MKHAFILTSLVAASLAAGSSFAAAPPPVALNVTDDGSEITLTWQAPSTTNTPTVEDFESYAPYIMDNCGGWTLYDETSNPKGADPFADPELVNYGESYGWQTYSNMAYDDKTVFTAYSGDMALATYPPLNSKSSRNWIVSPKLSGAAQTISFMARQFGSSYSAQYFKTYYSTRGTGADDWVVVEKYGEVKGFGWVRNSFDIPDGAVYFAIAISCSDNGGYSQAGIAVDDIIYCEEGNLPLVIAGYNVYADGVKINAEPVTDTEFKAPFEYAVHNYTVRALFTDGQESQDSEVFRFVPAWTHNAAITRFVPAYKLTAGADNKFVVRVYNDGSETIDCDIDLIFDGEVHSTETVSSLAAGISRDVLFTVNPGVFAAEEHTASATVRLEGEQYSADNSCETVSMVLHTAGLAPELSLAEGDGFGLTWVAAELPEVSQTLEDFESYDPFLLEFGDWTCIDADGLPSGGYTVTNEEMNNLMHYGMAYAWQTFTGSYFVDNTVFRAYSGDMAVAAHKTYGWDADDWLISPRLSGKAQTVTFYVSTWNEGTSSPYEILYSSLTNEIEDFKVLTPGQQATSNWNKVTVTLPKNATYFAIRHLGRYESTANMGIAVDDIAYYGENDVQPVLYGYNLYCDGILVNDEPLEVTEFAEEAEGDHTYQVTAVYDLGESAPSNAVKWPVAAAGIVSAAGQNIDITVSGGTVAVTGAHSVAIFSIDGKLVGTSTGDSTFTLAAGVYVVKADSCIEKIVVSQR